MSFCRHLEKYKLTKHSNNIKTRLHTILFKTLIGLYDDDFYQVFLILNVFLHALLPFARIPKTSQWTLAKEECSSRLTHKKNTSFFLWDSFCCCCWFFSYYYFDGADLFIAMWKMFKWEIKKLKNIKEINEEEDEKASIKMPVLCQC